MLLCKSNEDGRIEVAIILILDGDTDSRIMLKRLLELSGHSVIMCADEAEAVEAAGSRNPDLAVINMKTGFRWSRGVRGLLRAANGHMKIMTIADYVPEQISQPSMGDDFLVRPVDLETIETKVRELLESRNAQT